MQNAKCRMQNEGICFADAFIIFSERGGAKAKILRFAPLSQANICSYQNYFKFMPKAYRNFAFCILHSAFCIKTSPCCPASDEKTAARLQKF